MKEELFKVYAIQHCPVKAHHHLVNTFLLVSKTIDMMLIMYPSRFENNSALLHFTQARGKRQEVTGKFS